MKSKTSRILALLVVALMVFGAAAWAQFRADAAPSHGTDQFAVAAINSNGSVDHRIVLPPAAYTMVGANTPVTGSTICIQGDAKQFAAQLTLTGTMGGTAPTLAVVLQHSIDGGTNWITLKTYTVINATVTPASQYDSWSDVPASTAITFGDCYHAVYTFGGSGTVVANVGLSMIAK